MKALKRNRLRQLVQWEYITQQQANQLWRDYLRLFKQVQGNQRGYDMKKFTVIAKKWFDRINGNIYHSVRCIRHKDNAVIVGSFRYGYGEYYKQTALSVMYDAGWFKEYRQQKTTKDGRIRFRYTQASIYLLERENNYPIIWTVSKGLKRDCIANGQL